jgi:ubiquinone/menaquinone biosynthesis C-methylase UbiE
MSSDHGHAKRVREVFARQAATFEDDRHNHVFTEDARWLFESLRCEPQDLLLDVAAGTGHAARSLAGRVALAVAVDLTREMLQAGKASADAQGISNVVFLQGDALALPFLDESFDIVISRFASHHIERADVQLAEMARCLRAGGRIALADVVADEAPEIASMQDRLECMRDPSHTRTLPVSEIVAEMQALGLADVRVQAKAMPHELARWLFRANTPTEIAERITAELRAEVAGGSATGLRPFERDGELWLTQTWACVSAVKPQA